MVLLHACAVEAQNVEVYMVLLHACAVEAQNVEVYMVLLHACAVECSECGGVHGVVARLSGSAQVGSPEVEGGTG